MPLYTEKDRVKARHICDTEISHIREASTPKQVDERGWLWGVSKECMRWRVLALLSIVSS